MLRVAGSERVQTFFPLVSMYRVLMKRRTFFLFMLRVAGSERVRTFFPFSFHLPGFNETPNFMD